MCKPSVTYRRATKMSKADQRRTFREPRTPSYFTALTMGNDSFNPQVYGHQTHAIPYPHGVNVQLTVYNWDDGFHPFHFHGSVFSSTLCSFTLLLMLVIAVTSSRSSARVLT